MAEDPQTAAQTESRTPADATGGLIGADLIRDEARRAPDKPGVYRMYGEDGGCLYVGKARSLKKRILQYAQGRHHSRRTGLMVSLTRSMELVITGSETEALLLEASYIKSLKPRYNILLRDDKSFAELMIRRDHPAPQIRKHRGAHTTPGAYFGPFASTWAVNRTLTALQKAFLLRSCSDSVYASRTRPCILHQIKRCSAPCVGLIDLDDYAGLARQAEDFLRGRSRAVIGRLTDEMQAASDALDFETAARLRDRIRALNAVTMGPDTGAQGLDEADVFAIHLDGGQACVQAFFYRSGQNWGGRAYFPRIDREDDEATIMSPFLAQFYANRPIPPLILVSRTPHEQVLLQEAFTLKSGRRVEIATPQRGGKAAVVAHARDNAREALGRRLAETSAQAKILDAVCEAFGLEATPERIEVYDNAHIQGSNPVGGMIVAGPDGFQKSQYRKFNIKGQDLPPGDDYAMMREVLRRRFARLVKEEAEGQEGGQREGQAGARPDLVLIDGGAGQLAEAMAVMADLGVDDIAVVGVAKGPDRDAGRERFFMPGKAPFMLEPKSPALYYLQRLRDEAHRFANGAHAQRRSMDIRRNPLDEIDGVGPGRKKALLAAFGSAKGVSRADVPDLAQVPGVSQALAERIHGFFHKR